MRPDESDNIRSWRSRAREATIGSGQTVPVRGGRAADSAFKAAFQQTKRRLAKQASQHALQPEHPAAQQVYEPNSSIVPRSVPKSHSPARLSPLPTHTCSALVGKPSLCCLGVQCSTRLCPAARKCWNTAIMLGILASDDQQSLLLCRV